MSKMTVFGGSSSENRKYHKRLLPDLKELRAENRSKESHIKCRSSPERPHSYGYVPNDTGHPAGNDLFRCVAGRTCGPA